LTETGYDEENSKASTPPLSQQAHRFSDIFGAMLESRIKEQQIRFAEGCEDIMRSIVENLARQAFSLYVRVYGGASSSNSGSTRSHPQESLLSHVGGSFENLSMPRTSNGQHSLSTSLSVAAHSHSRSYSMENHISPHENQLLTDPRTHDTGVGHQFMPQMIQPNFLSASMEPGIRRSHPDHSRYSVDMETGLPSLSHDQFDNINLEAGAEPWFGFSSNHTGANFDSTNGAESMINANFLNLPTAPLAQTLVRSQGTGTQNLAGLGDWQQFQDSTTMEYDFGQ
jgi:hypothetical protein